MMPPRLSPRTTQVLLKIYSTPPRNVFSIVLVGLLSVALSTDIGRTACWSFVRPLGFSPSPGTASNSGIKVIGAGPGRTGTVSLAQSLEHLGYKPYHMKDCFVLDHADLWQRALDTQNIDQIASVLTRLGYDAILDEPGSDLVPLFAAKYPEAQVILTQRNPKSWVKSLHKLADLHRALSHAPFSFLPAVQRFSSLAKRILAKRRCYFADSNSNSGDCVAWYHGHMNEMNALFSGEDQQHRFLEYQVQDGWGPITQFLNQTGNQYAASHAFPRANSGDEIATMVKLLSVISNLFYAAIAAAAAYGLYSMLPSNSLYTRRRSKNSDGDKTVRVRGLSSVVPGVEGVPGMIVPTRGICRGLRDRGIHNPSKMKPISDDWAERYLCMTSVAFGEVDLLREQYGNKYWKTPPDAGNMSEEDLMYKAFDDAIEKANVKVEDLDALIYVSCTVDGIYFNDNMRQWYTRYPNLSRRLIPLTLPHGCPAYVFCLQLSQRLLQSDQIENIAIVISNSTSKRYSVEANTAFTQDNDMRLWLNACVFGDAAFSSIVSTSTENLPARTYKLLDADIVADPEVRISSRVAVNIGGPKTKPCDVFYLNPEGPQTIPKSLKYWFSHLSHKFGYTLDSFQHIVFHQANPKVVVDVCTQFGCLDKTSVVGAKYGNLAGTSIGVALHDRVEKSKELPKDKDLILGYALGALTGNSHGIFVLECEVREY